MTDQPPPTGDPSSRLAAARTAYAALRPRVEAGDPWPLAADFGTGPEASWGPREVLSHVAEMLPYWLGEFERVVEAGRGAGNGQPFGRTAEDTLRLGVLERDRTLPLPAMSHTPTRNQGTPSPRALTNKSCRDHL